MLNRKTLGVVGGVFAIMLAVAQPAFAQDRDVDRTQSDEASGRIRGEGVLPGRIGGGRRDGQDERRQRRERRQEEQQASAALTPEQIMAAAQTQLTAAGAQCQVAEAINPGLIGEAQVFEVACANAPGRIIIASTPPQIFDCLELAGSAAIARAADPAADVGQQCSLPANQNAVAVIGGYAREAGVACTVDEAIVVGKAGDAMVYEVGCGADTGYQLVKASAGWEVTDCFQLAGGARPCRFTTKDEMTAVLQGRLTGTEASGCNIADFRLMGQNPNGRFFEVKCAAEGEGYIARLNAEGVTQQIYPCATAQRIGGGCTLTPAPAAAPAAE